MSDMEKIQFGDQVFDLVADGVKLTSEGGTVTFQKGTAQFDNIELNLQKNDVIRQINTSGEIDWSRTDLAFAGILTQQSNYDIGSNVKVTVITATFRTPDTREEVEKTKAQVMYLSMMTGIGMEVFAL